MQTVSYLEAAKLLNCSINTIHKAVQDGRLSKAPSTSKQQKLIKEQVMLFLGKSHIRKSMLSEEELYLWNNYKEGNASKIEVEKDIPTDISIKREKEGETPSRIYEGISFFDAIGAYLETLSEKDTRFSDNSTSPFMKWLYRHNSMILKQHVVMFGTAKNVATKVILGIEAILFILRSLPENPNEQDVANTVDEILPDMPDREIIISLLSDNSARDYLKSVIAA